MKKNWVIAGLVLTGILLWDVFVLRPYNKKFAQNKVVETQKTEVANSSVTQGQNQTVNVETKIASSTNVAPANKSRNPQDIWVRSESGNLEIKLNENRKIEFLSGGRIGSLALSDYTVRGVKERQSVIVAKNGYQWISQNPRLDDCFSRFGNPVQNGQKIQYSAQNSYGKCFLEFESNSQVLGQFSVKLTLEGFKGEVGSMEFVGLDGVGQGPTTDHNFIMANVNESNKSYRDKDLAKSTLVEGKVGWLAWGDRYFVSALIQSGNWNPFVAFRALGGTEKEPNIYHGFTFPFNGDTANAEYTLGVYFGTRDGDILEKIRPDLAGAVDLGFFGTIARILLSALSAINKIFGNFGLSIIVLTLLVRLMFWPLNKKVYESGAKMKALQPEIEKLKAKYGNDKSKAQEMNVQLWNLYRQNKVNPLGSCLPLLLQMPIFFALYGALNHSLDLYQAPFAFWIQDLSSKDPFYVLPVLWTLSLLAYTKINPSQPTQPGAPDMKWIMIAMNLFIGFLSADWPSGLNLYLFVSNVVGISQQVFMQRESRKLQPVQEGA